MRRADWLRGSGTLVIKSCFDGRIGRSSMVGTIARPGFQEVELLDD